MSAGRTPVRLPEGRGETHVSHVVLLLFLLQARFLDSNTFECRILLLVLLFVSIDTMSKGFLCFFHSYTEDVQ